VNRSSTRGRSHHLRLAGSLGLVGAVSWLLWTVSQQPTDRQDRALALLGFACTVALPLVATALRWLWTHWEGGGEAIATIDLEVADQFGAAVRQQWLREAAERRLLAPEPIRVRWKRSDLPVTGTAVMPLGGPGRDGRIALPVGVEPSSGLRTGGLTELCEIFHTPGLDRVIILGEPGSGKTTIAVLLLLDALRSRMLAPADERRRIPVPVLFSIAGWDPIRQRLEDWIVGQLQRTYQMFDDHGPHVARTLVAGGQITLIVDGLDELARDIRPTALQALSDQATFRLLLLSRSRELVDAATTHHLPGALALELLPVLARDAAQYLSHTQLRPLRRPWRDVVDELTRHPTGVAGWALATPFMLTLLRDTYRTEDDPSELLDIARFPTATDLRAHLLARVVPAAYTARPGSPSLRHTPRQAERTLAFIAWRMSSDDTRDLAWWAIPRWIGPLPRCALASAVFGTMVGSTFGVTSAVIFDAAVGRGVGLIIGAIGAVSAAMAALGQATPRRLHAPTRRMMPHRHSTVAASKGAVPIGVLGGVVFGVVGGEVEWGLAYGLALMASSGLALGVAQHLGEPGAGGAVSSDPLTSWRRDRDYGFVVGAAAGTTAGLAFGLPVGLWDLITLGFEAGAESALGFGITVGALVALIFVFLAPRTWLTLVTLPLLRFRYGIPLRLMRFLDEARELQVLRTVGPVYQFRHAQLQEHLCHRWSSS